MLVSHGSLKCYGACRLKFVCACVLCVLVVLGSVVLFH